MEITIDIEKFKKCFPAIAKLYPTDEELQTALEVGYCGVQTYINTTLGAINLTPALQERAVYLAVAHNIFLANNPDSYRPVGNASQGSESIGFETPPTKTMLEYFLSSSPYGMQLLLILKSVAPLQPRIPNNIYPYYNSFGLLR